VQELAPIHHPRLLRGYALFVLNLRKKYSSAHPAKLMRSVLAMRRIAIQAA
jgi:hypothetical protein